MHSEGQSPETVSVFIFFYFLNLHINFCVLALRNISLVHTCSLSSLVKSNLILVLLDRSETVKTNTGFD